MIGDSLPEYIFIRVCIFILHYFPLHLLICLVLALIFDHKAYTLVTFLETVTILELSFYVLVWIPRSRALQTPARHPPVLPYGERQRLFQKCLETIDDPEVYLSKWFGEAPTAEIKRDNVKQFFCWAFLSRSYWSAADEAELENYTDEIGKILGRHLEPGLGSARPLLLTIDPVNMLHRPLVWYLIVAVVDHFTSLYLRYDGFSFHRLPPFPTAFSSFPFRPFHALSRHTSPSPTLTYWHRAHTSRSRKPILFIHGIGIGLFPYLRFLSAINASPSSDDGQIGIIAIELLPISFRITSEMPSQTALAAEIHRILAHHGWETYVLATHSYGSVLAANLLSTTPTTTITTLNPRPIPSQPRIAATLLIDPVAFLLSTPSVAYNFTRRRPRRANEFQLWYFASTDMMVAHTLARHFFWLQNVLWREDLVDRNMSVALSGRDLIVDTKAVGRYLCEDSEIGWGAGYERFLAEGEDEVGVYRDEEREGESGGGGRDGERDAWKERLWKGEGLDVLWFERCDHAQVFDRERDFRRLVQVLMSYCAES